MKLEESRKRIHEFYQAILKINLKTLLLAPALLLFTLNLSTLILEEENLSQLH